MRGKVEICGINTADLKVLKNDEMMALLRRCREGDTDAREQLICGNLRLVLSVIQRFLGRGENVDDLFQVGCIGLIKAIDNFDIRQPVRFSTYGVPMIVGEIRRYLRDNSAIRVSRSMRDTAYRVLQAREQLMSQNRGQRLRYGSGAGQQQQRRALAGADQPEGRHCPAGRAAAEYPGAAVLPGQDPDGGVIGDRHFPGPGEPAGKGRHRLHQARNVKKCKKMHPQPSAADAFFCMIFGTLTAVIGT